MIRPGAIEPGLNMAATRPSPKMRAWGLGTVIVLLLAAPFLFVHASDKPGTEPSFLPMYATAAFICDAITAYLLSIQFINSRQVGVGLVAAAYGFTAPVILFQLCVFPGVFAETGLFHAGGQAAIWLWLVWHCGFPTLILWAIGIEANVGRKPVSRRGYYWTMRAVFVLPPVMAVVLSTVVIGVGERLPVLVVAGSYTLLQSPLGLYAIVANVLALASVLWVGRWRSVLMLWLSVAMLCSLLDVSLTLAGGARYTVGWYASRVLSIATASLLLGITLWEINKLYAGLSRSNRQLADLASHDGLTGVRNRRRFDEDLKKLLAQATLDQEPIALLICDVDHFKKYNDSFGHLQGDEALIAVARALSDTCRDTVDVVARYGGEEFALILPEQDVRLAMVVAERVRQAVLDLEIEGADGLLSVSIGVAARNANEAVTATSLIGLADGALYDAKRQGRNRVVAAGTAMAVAAAC